MMSQERPPRSLGGRSGLLAGVNGVLETKDLPTDLKDTDTKI